MNLKRQRINGVPNNRQETLYQQCSKKVLVYLEKEWSYKVAAEFLLKIDRRIELLTKQPFVGAPSSKIKDVRGLLITRHNRLYYKIKNDKVIILAMYDTRINPEKNPY